MDRQPTIENALLWAATAVTAVFFIYSVRWFIRRERGLEPDSMMGFVCSFGVVSPMMPAFFLWLSWFMSIGRDV